MKIYLTLISTIFLIATQGWAQQPPANLAANFDQDQAQVILNWTPPTIDPGEWIHWDGESADANSVGLTNGGTFRAAARFAAADLEPYSEFTVSHLRFKMYDPDASYTAYVWEGGDGSTPGTVIVTQPFSEIQFGVWKEIELDEPFQIQADTEYWFGYEITHDAGNNPAGADDGPMIADKGGWIYFNNAWSQIADFGLNYNWNIQAKVFSQNGAPTMISARKINIKDYANRMHHNPVDSDWLTCVSNPLPPQPETREDIESYKIYRSDAPADIPPGELIATIPADVDSFVDADNLVGGIRYYYGVSAVYDTGDESQLSNIASAQILFDFEVALGYDDGSPEADLSYGEPGTGLAVRFTSTSQDTTYLKKALFYFSLYPDDMTEFAPFILHVWGVETDGTPGADLIDPIPVTIDVEPEMWLSVDLQVYTIKIEPAASFYVGLIESENSNYLGFDQTTPHYQRTWGWDGVEWSNIADLGVIGDLMIRTIIQQPGTTAIEDELPNPSQLTFHLNQNHPNPFNPSTTISYQIPRQLPIEITIYNATGQKIRTLFNQQQLPGTHTVNWNGLDDLGRSVSSGTYFYRLRAGDVFQDQKQMIFLK